MLRFGIHSGQQHTSFDEFLDMWRVAEDAGLEWASLFDHFVPIWGSREGPSFEGFTLLAALAAHTERLRLGMIVAGVTYRHPAVLTSMATTIDHVSGGRLELGLGAAWFEAEHAMYGLPFPRIGQRMDMLDEACRIVKGLWTQKRTTFDGKHYRLEDALSEPKPVQRPHPPLWIGGSGERRTLRIAAEHADGWNTFLMPEDEYRHKLDVLEGHCRDVGRDPAEIRKQLVVRAVLCEREAEADARVRERAAQLGSDPDELRRDFAVETADRLAERLVPYARMGVEDLILQARPPADRASIELFASVVAPAVRAAV